LESAGLNIQLQTVLNEWRCPSQVECAEAGNATAVIDVWLTGQDPTRFEVNINPPPFERDVLYDAYQIQLLTLDPYPEVIDQVIPQEDYRATLVVNPAPPLVAAEPTTTPTPPAPTATLVEPDNELSSAGPSLEAENHYLRGLVMVASGLPEEAIASLTEAITLYPVYIEAYQIRGDAYRQLRRYDLARADYQQDLALNPNPEIQATVSATLEEIAGATSVLPTATVTPTPAPATPLPSPPVTIRLDAPFALKLNQQGVLAADGLTVEFSEILEDSRCPRQVDCVWSGQGRLVIYVWLTGQEPTAFELNTLSSLHQSVISYEAYQVELLSLDPYPETPELKITLEDYQATFVVSLR
jgi:tetratricopeptide (TPR) repeat protein